jgi:acyl dehydratase
VYQRLVVGSVWSKVAGIVGRGFETKLHRPVRPGMVLTGKTRITRVTLRPERRNAVVLMQTELTDEAGEGVLTLILDTLIHMRPQRT